MWTNSELKERGKTAMKGNYVMVLITSILLTFLTGGTAGSSVGGSSGKINENDLSSIFGGDVDYMAILAAIIGVVVTIVAIMSIVNILVFNPLKVGCQNFFVRNTEGPAELSAIGGGFSPWGRNVCAMFLTDLFLTLWFMLFIIPGFIKAYSYRLVPYILADDPDISAMDAITRSREMMNGNKMKAFLLDLSFIGWWLLSAITCGLLAVFYVQPYYNCTCAELYRTIKGEEVVSDIS